MVEMAGIKFKDLREAVVALNEWEDSPRKIKLIGNTKEQILADFRAVMDEIEDVDGKFPGPKTSLAYYNVIVDLEEKGEKAAEKAEKAAEKATKKESKEEGEKVVKEKPAKEKVVKEKKVAKKAPPKDVVLSPLGHRVPSQAAEIDDLLVKGATKEDFIAAGLAWPRTYMHITHFAKEHDNCKIEKDEAGVYKAKILKG